MTDSAQTYEQRYNLKDVYQKRTDDQGAGFQDLYGTRNLRSVLNGIVFRGGANNAYLKPKSRSNSNPLPDVGLNNLCAEGFSTAVYLYPTNYSTAPHTVTCQARSFRGTNTLTYLQASPLSSNTTRDQILKMVFDKLSSHDPRPMYLHCWNGWHASGFISATILRQFCGWSATEAVNYWNQNTDGNDGKSFEGIRQRIRNYSPRTEWQLDAQTRELVCPASI